MLGTPAATYYVIYTVMQVPTGVLNDTLGPRRVLGVGCLVAGWVLDRSAAGAAYTGAHYVLGPALLTAFAGIGLAGAWFIKETHCRNIWAELDPLRRTA